MLGSKFPLLAFRNLPPPLTYNTLDTRLRRYNAKRSIFCPLEIISTLWFAFRRSFSTFRGSCRKFSRDALVFSPSLRRVRAPLVFCLARILGNGPVSKLRIPPALRLSSRADSRGARPAGPISPRGASDLSPKCGQIHRCTKAKELTVTNGCISPGAHLESGLYFFVRLRANACLIHG